jgi:phosphoribosyl-AMP cyclohydrolase
MMQHSEMDELKKIAGQFEWISLVDTSTKVALQERIDAKYVLSNEMLPSILKACQHEYQILEVNQNRLCKYETIYYDTSSLAYYHAHHAGHLNRIKIRVRKYIDSDTRYLEVKHKNNKGYTKKSRKPLIQYENDYLTKLKDPEFMYISSMIKEDLEQSVQIDYTRITLVNIHSKERVTIDINLSFRNKTGERELKNYVVAEVKQYKSQPSFFKSLMKKESIREGAMSKYCLGITQLYRDVKKNHFKVILNKIEKENTHGATASCYQYN